MVRSGQKPPRKCKHGVQYHICIKCKGPSVCKHSRRRSRCKDCHGAEICKHNRVHSSCKACGGNRFCVHNRIKYRCGLCFGLTALANGIIWGARTRAKKNNWPFDLTKEDVLELLGDGRCPVFGFPYNLDSRKVSNDSATLDKFSSEEGYTKKNCAVISWLANMIKTSATAQQVRRVADWMDEQEAKRGLGKR
jgi:hypothetical protein